MKFWIRPWIVIIRYIEAYLLLYFSGVKLAYPGECVQSCTIKYIPVCGVDGLTYYNKCYLKLAYVFIVFVIIYLLLNNGIIYFSVKYISADLGYISYN